MDSRTEVEKYSTGCRILENFLIRVEGGVTKAPGTYYGNAAKYNDKTTILRSFVFSADQAYMLEFGDCYIRFYIDGARIEVTGVPVELVTPYKYTELRDLRFQQSADVLCITCKNHAPRKLERTSHIDWTLTAITFTSSEEETTQNYIAVSGTANSGGLIKITTATAHGFLPNSIVTIAGVGGTVEANGQWRISIISSTSFVLLGSVFTNTWVAGGTAIQEIGYWISNTSNVGGKVNINVVSHNFETGDMVTVADIVGTEEALGTWIVTKVDDDNVILQGSVYATTYTSGGYIVGAGPFTTHDITACADNGAGLIRVTTESDHNFTTGNHVAIEGIVGTIEANDVWIITKIDANNFDLQESTFTNAWVSGGQASNRWPATISFFEERLGFAGTYEKPLTVWLSKSGDYYNITTGDSADSALIFTLLSRLIGKSMWLVSQEYLMIGNTDSEWRMGGKSTTEPITFDSINAKYQESNGSANIQAVLACGAVLFVQRGGRRVRELAYSYANDKYQTPDMTRLAYHITESGIIDISVQVIPEPLIWCVKENGSICVMIYNRLEEVIGWMNRTTGKNSSGRFESVCVIPSATGEDVVWFSTIRLIDGQEKRYIEYMKPIDFGTDPADGFFVDCGLTFDGGVKLNLTAITVANPPVVTCSDGSILTDGNHVRFVGVRGMVELNDNVYKVAGLAANSFHLHNEAGVNIDGSAFTAFATNLTIIKCYESDNVNRRIRVKVTTHGLTTGDEINIFGVLGCTEANGIWDVTVIDANNIELDESNYVHSYLSGGYIGGYVEKVAKYVTGIDHLEGCEVAICGDGGAEPNDTVVGGALTLDAYFNKIHVGLPIRARLQPMKPDIGGSYGTSQGINKRIDNIVARFENTLDCKYGSDENNLIDIVFDEDGTGRMFTGDKDVSFEGDYDGDGLTLFESEKPVPCSINGVIIKLKGYDS
jgi:hypothetical protein